MSWLEEGRVAFDGTLAKPESPTPPKQTRGRTTGRRREERNFRCSLRPVAIRGGGATRERFRVRWVGGAVDWRLCQDGSEARAGASVKVTEREARAVLAVLPGSKAESSVILYLPSVPLGNCP